MVHVICDVITHRALKLIAVATVPLEALGNPISDCRLSNNAVTQ